jgi:hypothetical protein
VPWTDLASPGTQAREVGFAHDGEIAATSSRVTVPFLGIIKNYDKNH